MARTVASAEDIVRVLEPLASDENREGMARFGIRPAHPLGIGMTQLRKIARRYEHGHGLALDLWATGIHEARLLATVLDLAAEVTTEQMDDWATGFDSWDICDQACLNLFDRTPFVIEKAHEWAQRARELERRAGFALMATAAAHRRDFDDAPFLDFLPVLREGMTDDRNFVKKAVSWGFRQIGKRNSLLRGEVLHVVGPLITSDDHTTRWIARDVSRELTR